MELMMKSGLVMLVCLLAACQATSGRLEALIVIEWTTASEINTAGFNLYRSVSPTDSFTCINAQLIPASNDPLVGGRYRYEDTEVTAGKTYYYQLEDVELSGKTTRHEPIAVTASARADESALLIAFAFGALLVIVAVWLLRVFSAHHANPANRKTKLV